MSDKVSLINKEEVCRYLRELRDYVEYFDQSGEVLVDADDLSYIIRDTDNLVHALEIVTIEYDQDTVIICNEEYDESTVLVPLVKGEWIYKNGKGVCSVCGSEKDLNNSSNNYCPNCGAYLGGE